MPQQTQTREIRIKVDTTGSKGLEDVASKMGLLNKNVKSLKDNFASLTTSIQGYVAFLGIRELARTADEMQNLGSRLKLVSLAGEDTARVLGNIQQVADRTNQSITDVGTVYTRLASSLKSAKATTGELSALTESLINTFRIAGATSTETTNTIIQLSQAFSSTQLRGQELRSVLEQNATLAGFIRERYGSANIFKAAEEGAIRASDVIAILSDKQKELLAQAKVLTPTFEQTMTKAFNVAAIAIGKLNEEFKISSKFAELMGVSIQKLTLILSAFGAVVTVLAIQSLPYLFGQIVKLGTISFAFFAKNPLLLAFGAVATLAVSLSKNLDDFIDKLRNLAGWAYYVAAAFRELVLETNKWAAGVGRRNVSKEAIKGFEEEALAIERLRDKALELGTAQAKVGGPAADPFAEADKNIKSLLDKIKAQEGAVTKTQKIKEILGQINKEYAAGSITISEYNRKLISFELYKVNREFKEGKDNVFGYNEKIKSLRFEELNRQLADGGASLQFLNSQFEELNTQALNDKFEAGKISLQEYNTELTKLNDKFQPGAAFISGTASYIKSIGTLSEGIAKGIENTFKALEDGLVDFVKEGTFNFNKFTQTVLDDLTRIIIRASIIKPIAEGLLGAGFSTQGSSAGGTGSIGGVGQTPIQAFASGGVVTRATAFGMAGGGVGVAGEAGPEAILPLKRGPGGGLGVAAAPVQINIVNNSGAEISTNESVGSDGSRNITVLINKTVRDGIARGEFDRTMQNSYGLNRKGV